MSKPIPDEWKLLVSQFRQGQVPPRQLAEMQALLRSLHCPFCAAGPFQQVLQHISIVHQMDGATVRDWFGLRTKDSLTGPETHARRSAHSKRLFDAGVSGWTATPEERSALFRAAPRNRAKVKVPREDYPAVTARVLAGESVPAIAAEYGASRQLIYEIAAGDRDQPRNHSWWRKAKP